MLKQALTLLAAQVFLVGSAWAGDITLSQRLDRAAMAFEDSATLEIRLTWPGPITAYLIEGPLRPELERLKVRSYRSSVSASGSGETEMTTKVYTFVLEPTGPGIGRIAPMEIRYMSAIDSVPGTLVTEALEVNIAEPRPAADRTGMGRSVVILAGAVFVALAGLGIWTYVRRRKTRPAEPQRTPAEMFLDELQHLRQEASGDLKRFKAGLYPLLARYLHRQYDIVTDRCTADDLVARLEQLDLAAARRERLALWLRESEQAKYRPVTGQPGETIRLETELREFFANLT